MIHMRVDKVNKVSDRHSDTLLTWLEVPQVPEVGELINVEGNPYHVVERGWAYDNPCGICTDSRVSAARSETETFCYLRVR